MDIFVSYLCIYIYILCRFCDWLVLSWEKLLEQKGNPTSESESSKSSWRQLSASMRSWHCMNWKNLRKNPWPKTFQGINVGWSTVSQHNCCFIYGCLNRNLNPRGISWKKTSPSISSSALEFGSRVAPLDIDFFWGYTSTRWTNSRVFPMAPLKNHMKQQHWPNMFDQRLKMSLLHHVGAFMKLWSPWRNMWHVARMLASMASLHKRSGATKCSGKPWTSDIIQPCLQRQHALC